MERRGQSPIGVYTHIEKAGGTSDRFGIEQGIGKDGVFVFSPEANRLVRSSDNLMPATTPFLDRVRQTFGNPVLGPVLVTFWPAVNGIYRERIRRGYPQLEVPADAKVIMGHFTADNFDAMLEGREQITAFKVRDPLDRAISHFLHWYRNRGYEDWRVHIPFQRKKRKESMEDAFKKYAMLPQLQNYQTQALMGRKYRNDLPVEDVTNAIKHIDIVGVTEYSEEFLEAFLLRLSQAGLTLPRPQEGFEQRRLNVTPERRWLRVDKNKLGDEFLNEFREKHALDYTLYEQAKAIQERRMAPGNSGK